MGRFSSAVLNSIDAAGYPYNVRCHPQADEATMTLRLDIPASLELQPGKASLLWHKHDQQLWNQVSFLVRGTLARDDQGWLLQPSQYVAGIEQSPMAFYRFLRESRRKAAAYLAARKLPRPTIPWNDIEAVKRRVK
jgi:hypothetical protein